MLEYRNYGAIDIGSNAMRLLICRVMEDGNDVRFKKVSLVRLPIRLGADSFTDGKISEETRERFLDGMKAFHYLMKVHKVVAYRACATSAMREALNGEEIAKQILEEANIDIEIITGKLEAQMIYEAHFKNKLDVDSNYIYVDVGGGSTELTMLSKGEVVASKSFKIGTIRLLNDIVEGDVWGEMKQWIRESTAGLDHVEMIGSGGNITKLYKLLDKEYPRPMLYHELKNLRSTLCKMSYEQRIKHFNLNPDRADVIIPASEIYYSAMKWADASICHVPKIGLSDGIVMWLYNKEKAEANG